MGNVRRRGGNHVRGAKRTQRGRLIILLFISKSITACALLTGYGACTDGEEDVFPPPLPLETLNKEIASIDAIDNLLERFREVQTELSAIHAENESLRAEIEALTGELDAQESRTVQASQVEEPADVQPSPTASQTYEATFYTASCDGCSGITYSGHDVRNTIYTPEGLRVIAVDPDEIALGTHVRVTMSDGSSFEAEASDIGSDIKGNRIDVLVATKEEAFKLGRQGVRVEVVN